MRLAAGQTLTFYEILGPLGAGGMGEVWRARDTRLEREVAIKVLPGSFAHDDERLRRFEREAKTLASLNHPVFGVSPLAMAALHGDARLARVLLAGGATVDVRSRDGSTPLSGAAFLGRVEVLELLLEKGADPDLENFNGDTILGATVAPWPITSIIAGMLDVPLDRPAVKAGRTRCAEILKSHKKAANDPTTRLFEAISAGDTKAVEAALTTGASLKDRNIESGWTPLSTAVFLDEGPTARILLEQGADANARNKDQSTTLHGAALLGLTPLVELLIKHGACVDARDSRSSTPLHAAAFLGRAQAAERLLRAKADKSLMDVDGQTALDVTRVDWPTTQFVLQMLGIEVEREAVEQGRAEVAKMLGE